MGRVSAAFRAHPRHPPVAFPVEIVPGFLGPNLGLHDYVQIRRLPHPLTFRRRALWIGFQQSASSQHATTSIVERQNLTMRTQIRRLTRLTNAGHPRDESGDCRSGVVDR
jgi:hypothetical protein